MIVVVAVAGCNSFWFRLHAGYDCGYRGVVALEWMTTRCVCKCDTFHTGRKTPKDGKRVQMSAAQSDVCSRDYTVYSRQSIATYFWCSRACVRLMGFSSLASDVSLELKNKIGLRLRLGRVFSSCWVQRQVVWDYMRITRMRFYRALVVLRSVSCGPRPIIVIVIATDSLAPSPASFFALQRLTIPVPGDHSFGSGNHSFACRKSLSTIQMITLCIAHDRYFGTSESLFPSIRITIHLIWHQPDHSLRSLRSLNNH